MGCIKKNNSTGKVEYWSPDLSSSLQVGTGYNPETSVFREDCTNITLYPNSIEIKETSQHKEFSSLSESAQSNGLSVSGSVELNFAKQGGGFEGSNSSESSSKVAVGDNYIFMKKKK